MNDLADMQKAVRRLADETGCGLRDVMIAAAKGTVSSVVLITPPASQHATGAEAKKAGEATIQNDILKLAAPAVVVGAHPRKAFATAADLLSAHEAARRGTRGGRVNPRNREKLLMPIAQIVHVINLLQKSVGILAAGWNRAAAYLGVRMPAWIKRHGDAAGVVKVEASAFRFRLTVGNAVKFVDDVRDYERRIDKALDYEAGKLNRQANFLHEKAMRKAGFK